MVKTLQKSSSPEPAADCNATWYVVNQYHGLALTYFTSSLKRSLDFCLGKSENDFSETIAAYDLIAGRCIQQNE